MPLYVPRGSTKQVVLRPNVSDSSGNGYPALVAGSNIRGLFTAYTKDVDGYWYGNMRIPQDYLSTPKIILRVGANSTAGQVTSFIVGTLVRDTAAGWDASAYTAETAIDTTLSTTAYRPSDITFNLSTSPVAGSDLLYYLEHNGTKTEDTLAVDTILFEAVFQYVASS